MRKFWRLAWWRLRSREFSLDERWPFAGGARKRMRHETPRPSRKKRNVIHGGSVGRQTELPLPAPPRRPPEPLRFPFPDRYFAKIPVSPPSPAGEGEPGPSGSGAASARAVREAPSGGRLREGGQEALPVRAVPAVPVELEPCVYCGRRGFMRVMHHGQPEARCSWHLMGPDARLPADVRRASR